MTVKLLISAGCSFTQVPNTYENWPKHLCERLNLAPMYLGQGAGSNGLIAKKALLAVENALQNYSHDEILLGVMWSGPDRKEIYSSSQNFPFTDFNSNVDRYRNPLRLVDNYNWYLVNAGFKDESSKIWYKHFHDDIGATIATIENILTVQYYCKSKNIKYFMTTYAPHTLPNEYLTHSDVKPFYNMIDMRNFLPVTDALRWMMNSGKWHKNEEDGHPPTEANIEFVDRVIIPHLKNVGYIE